MNVIVRVSVNRALCCPLLSFHHLGAGAQCVFLCMTISGNLAMFKKKEAQSNSFAHSLSLFHHHSLICTFKCDYSVDL